MQRFAMSFTREATHLRQATLRRLYWWVRTTVTLVLAVYLVWRVRAEVGTLQLHLARPPRLALALGCVVLAMILSAWLWHVLIPPASRVSFRQLLAHYLLGFFWNNFLPSGLGGDAVRALALYNASGRASVAISSVLMARIAGLWSIVLLATTAALFYMSSIGWYVALPLLSIAVGSLIITAGGTAFLLGAPMSAFMQRLPAWLGDWHASLRAYCNQPARLLQALGWAFVIQLCAVAINAFMAQALDLAITPSQLLLSMPLINLMVLLPVSLGGFGLREGSYLYFLGLVGVAAADAILLALAVYVLLILVAAVGAGICTSLIPHAGTHPDMP
jgi:uncharacterized membrane protein YbhN (UPF0104 family)